MVKHYQSPEEFWREVAPPLREDEAKNNLLLGLSLQFRAKPENCLYQGAYWQNGQLKGAAIGSRFSTNRNFIASSIADTQTAQALFADYQSARPETTGLIAELETAKTYEKLFLGLGKKSRVIFNQGLYRCREVKMPARTAQLHFRAAATPDTPTLARWIEEFHAEAVPEDPRVIGIDAANARLQQKTIFVLECEGRLVSMACFGRDLGTSCSVNLVYTPKDERGRGFGSVVTAELTDHLLREGRRETNLFTDLRNSTSNKIYREIGYEMICESIYLGLHR